MTEWTSSEVLEVIGSLFTLWSMGWAGGYCIAAWRKIWNHF